MREEEGPQVLSRIRSYDRLTVPLDEDAHERVPPSFAFGGEVLHA